MTEQSYQQLPSDQNDDHFTKYLPVLEDIRNLKCYCRYCNYNHNTKQKDIIYEFVLVHTFSYCSDYCKFNHGCEFRRRYYGNVRNMKKYRC